MELSNMIPLDYSEKIVSIIRNVERETGKPITYFTLNIDESEGKKTFGTTLTFSDPLVSRPVLDRLIEKYGAAEGVRRYRDGEIDAPET